jgi:protein-S-isoprenylcysteine O-methyltransferase Ste14
MWRAKANILPHRAATALVTHGPFAFSRNPIYLGNTILLLGAGLAFAMAWFVPIALLAAALTAHFAIAREEAHLNARFGRDWRNYALQVNRWLGRRTPSTRR